MKIISVNISNILSIENASITFDDKGLMLVDGWNHDVGRANGAGKTAIFNAISFALYDKLPRKITATEVLRRGAKTGSVHVVVEVRGELFSVIRTRPKGVAFYAGKRTDDPVLSIGQDEWEAKLGLNYDQFMMAVYCAQGTNNRFLSVSDAEKKNFLLQLLSLEEFSASKHVADSKVKSLTSEFETLNNKKSVILSRIEAYSESLIDESVVSSEIEKKDHLLSQLTQQFNAAKSVLAPDLTKYQQAEESVLLKKNEIIKAKARREMLHGQYRRLGSKVQPFDDKTSCDACGAELDNAAAKAAHEHQVDSVKLEMQAIKVQIDECDSVIVKEAALDELLQKIRLKKKQESKDYEDASLKALEIKSRMNLIAQERANLNAKLQNNSELQSKIKNLTEQQEELEKSSANIFKDIEFYKVVAGIYSATGAQAYILDSVIDSFNELLNKEYMCHLWPNATYEIQSYKENGKGDITAKFSDKLVMNGKEVSIGSLSGGENKAISLCIDFALVDVMERHFGIQISPIILDEPFDGLDSRGRELVIELLENAATKRLIIVIDHASEVKSMFSKTLHVDKRNDISVISGEM